MSSKISDVPIRYLDTIQPVEVKFLARPYLPIGKFVLLIGDPGVGKSTLAMNIAAMLSTGRPILESDSEPIIGSIIYQSAENPAQNKTQTIFTKTLEPQQTLKNRFGFYLTTNV